jgi:arginyl-tRNA--protein-N-Asp/Glu arginylyltransferase
MESLLTVLSPPTACEYLPDRLAQLRYDLVPDLQPSDYVDRLKAGWRRFGYATFRPECASSVTEAGLECSS